MNRRGLFGFLGGLGFAVASGTALASVAPVNRVFGSGTFSANNGPMVVVHPPGHVPSMLRLVSSDGSVSFGVDGGAISVSADRRCI